MSSSIDGANEVIGLEMVFDVTERTKQILIAVNDGDKGHPLIAYDETQTHENILSDFRRGAVRVVNGIEYSGRLFPRKHQYFDEDMAESAHQVEQSVLTTYLAEFENMGIKDLSQYNSQAFSSIATNRVLLPALGNNPAIYKPSFSNGQVCHFWKESANGEDYLCLLSIHDGFNITINVDEKECYIPGAMTIELKVPFSVIQKKDPITEEHIKQVLVTSKEVYSLLNTNSNIECEALILQASSEPVFNFGPRVMSASFRKDLSEAHLIEVLKDENDDDSDSEDSLAASSSNHSSGDASPVVSDESSDSEIIDDKVVENRNIAYKDPDALIILLLLEKLNSYFDIRVHCSKNKIQELAAKYVKNYKENNVKKHPEEFLRILLEAAIRVKPKTEASLFSGFASFFSKHAEEQCSAEDQFYEHVANFLEDSGKVQKLIGFLEKNQMPDSITELENMDSNKKNGFNIPTLN